MFLSIVTISYNQARYLRQCLDSVVSQKGNDVEYIVVDPGSTDGSRDILSQYKGSIDHLVLDRDNGPADGLNKGFSKATGAVGYFINSDDFLLPGAVDRMRQLWSKNCEIDILLGSAWMINGRGEPIRVLRPTDTTLERLLDPLGSMVQQGMSFRLDLFERVGGFNKINRTCWDYEMLCMMLSAGARLHTTSSRLAAFRFYQESLSGGANGEAHAQRYLADLERIYTVVKDVPYSSNHAAATPLRRVIRQATHPGHAVQRLMDGIYPAGMRRRWSHDIARTEGRN